MRKQKRIFVKPVYFSGVHIQLFKILLCYVLYLVRLEFMHQGIADWPFRV
jgi:hypothetical protein